MTAGTMSGPGRRHPPYFLHHQATFLPGARCSPRNRASIPPCISWPITTLISACCWAARGLGRFPGVVAKCASGGASDSGSWLDTARNDRAPPAFPDAALLGVDAGAVVELPAKKSSVPVMADAPGPPPSHRQRAVHPLGLHLERREAAFDMDGLLARAAARSVRPATWVDVGASDGIWSVRAHRHFPAAKFLLFEPLAERQAGLEKLRAARGFYSPRPPPVRRPGRLPSSSIPSTAAASRRPCGWWNTNGAGGDRRCGGGCPDCRDPTA